MANSEDRYVPEDRQHWNLEEFASLEPPRPDYRAMDFAMSGGGIALGFLFLLLGQPALSVFGPVGSTVTGILSVVAFLIILLSAGMVVRTALAVAHDPYRERYREAKRQHQLDRQWPINLPRDDRHRLERLANAYVDFDDELEEIADRDQRRSLADALSPQSGESLRQTASLNPGQDALRIVTSRAWSDPWLRDHRLDIDPIQEATDIYDYLGQVATKINEFTEKAQQHQGTPTADTYRQYIKDLTADLSAVRGRAQALANYQAEIDRLSTLLAAEAAQPQLEQDADAVRDLVAESRRHELAAEHLARQRQELQQIESGLREIRSLLSDDTDFRLPGASYPLPREAGGGLNHPSAGGAI